MSVVNKINIKEKWLVQSHERCRYNSFITIYFIVLSDYINSCKDNKEFINLQKLNELILSLVDEISENNMKKIVKFIQEHKYEYNNEKIDNLIVYDSLIAENDIKVNVIKKQLILDLKNERSIVYESSGYIS